MQGNKGTGANFAADLIDVIHGSKIFAEIDRAACEALLPRLEKVFIAQGDVLFEQGDPSDCLYIVIDGQLLGILNTLEGKQKTVGPVENGETVGELGIISNQPRSLTIRAAVDSWLLKLPRLEFEAFCKEQPKFISRIIDLIVSRSQNTLKFISQKKLYKHIAIIPGHNNVPIEQFLETLKDNFAFDSRFSLSKKISRETNLSAFIEEAEASEKTAIFVLQQENFFSLKDKINHLGGIYIVVDGDNPMLLSEFALSMLNKHQTPFATQYELVLLHAEHVEKPTGTIEWLNQADFTLHHHLRINDTAGYQRLLRFMEGKAVGLVIGGGGGKGWVGIGAIKAILEANIPIDAIGGTSIGSIAASAFVYSHNYEETFEIFKILIESNNNPFALTRVTWPHISLLDAKKQTLTAIETFGDTLIEDLWLPFFSVSCNLSKGTETIHRKGLLWEKLRATAAVPGIIPPMLIEGDLHYDGGLVNNLPIDAMRNLLGEESFIIAVSLSNSKVEEKTYHFPAYIPFWMGLLNKLRLGYRNLRFPPFLNTFLQALLVGAGAKEKTNQLLADILIKPDLSQFKTFEFNAKRTQSLIEIGYSAMREQIKNSNIKTYIAR